MASASAASNACMAAGVQSFGISALIPYVSTTLVMEHALKTDQKTTVKIIPDGRWIRFVALNRRTTHQKGTKQPHPLLSEFRIRKPRTPCQKFRFRYGNKLM